MIYIHVFKSFFLASIILIAWTQAKSYTCTPGQPCWPEQSDWAAFNSSINGKLGVARPLAAPCFGTSPFYSTEACSTIEDQYENGTYRSVHYGSLEKLTWEKCGPASCQLDADHPPTPPVAGDCQLGALSYYYIAATCVEDVQKTLAFVNQQNLRLSIKNTGYASLARNVAPNSLALWVWNMKNLDFFANFEAYQCDTEDAGPVGLIGAGVTSREASDYFAGLGMDVTVSEYNGVGASGGFGMGGGHGPLAPKFGLMVDQAVEFDVVTADGQYRTVNKCNDPGLFYALRGGGGSTFAAMINYKAKLYPSTPLHFYSFAANITHPSDYAHTQSVILPAWFQSYIDNQPLWADNDIASWHFLRNLSVESYLVLPTTEPQTTLEKLTAGFRTMLTSLSGVTITLDQFSTHPNLPSFQDEWAVVARTHNFPGVGSQETTRMVPRSLFAAQATGDSTFLNALLNGTAEAFTRGVAMEFISAMPTSHPDNSATGVNPAFRNALTQVEWVFRQGPDPDLNDPRLDVAERANSFIKAITPGSGSNMYEGNWRDEEWQQSFFGENYERLLEIKQRYDPEGMFSCFKCVGWTGYEDGRYSCFTDKPVPTVDQKGVSDLCGPFGC